MIFIDDKDEKKFFNIQRVLYIYLVHLLYNKTNIIHESYYYKDTGNYLQQLQYVDISTIISTIIIISQRAIWLSSQRRWCTREKKNTK